MSVNGKDLMAKKFPPIAWTIEGILPQATILLAGKPKMGKSWLALDMAISVANGSRVLTNYQTTKSGVYYMALEDNERRIHQRVRDMGFTDLPDSIHFEFSSVRLDWQGLTALAKWLKNTPGVGLVIIDTLGKARPSAKGSSYTYDEDYKLIEALGTLRATYGFALVLVHHLRKMPADDPFDEVCGSVGLTGAVDGTWILKRPRNSDSATLLMTGRDTEEVELKVQWLPEKRRWVIQDAQMLMSPERRSIISILYPNKRMTPAEVARELNKDRNAVKTLMRTMEQESQLRKDVEGGYFLPDLIEGSNIVTVPWGQPK
jgi:RecA-family ATPase